MQEKDSYIKGINTSDAYKSFGDQWSLLSDYDPAGQVFIQSQTDKPPNKMNILATSTPFNIQLVVGADNDADNLVNLKRVNDTRYVNKFFETVNENLRMDATYIGCFESKEQRKERIFDKYPFLVAYLFYYLIDFPWKRIFPKVSGLHKIYYGLSKDHNRVLSLSEVLGRLKSCGFSIDTYEEVDGRTFFAVTKRSNPVYDEDPTYGPLITLNRVAKEGQIIQVYKFRTMHPYSEYLQEFVHQKNDLQEGGKFKNDFRITNWGQIMRKLWIDELPMFYNWFKGELKLIGVRPLSEHYFELYPEQFQKRRIQYKPGLIPPFYADMPQTFEEILASEKKYMMEYDKHPILTDVKYFFKSLYNILIKRARSN